MTGSTPDEKSLFNAARRLDPTARRELLDRACGDDSALRDRLDALLRVHDEDEDFLLAASTGIDLGCGDAAGETPGTVIGPYTLHSRLGEGGMGVVFLAEQAEPVRRQVALKLIRPGLDPRHALARFEGERQALALMDHPNIARVYDGGTTPNGRAYFVMELVKGVPITQFCDVRQLTLSHRLKLFVQVCRGVQHAHQKGVVHRDLKPSNVLVTLYDGQPVPKIIDFGLAKATEDSTVMARVTQVGQIVGTPEYMAPEQTGGTADIDTRADVYSLGVLLYELLTGTTPLRREGMAGFRAAEIIDRIRDEEAQPPSRRVADSGLGSQVRGDLDWIALKCLEKDRDRRYESAAELARDVERFLRHEPVEASPPSVGYRLRKLVRRHRTTLAVAAIFVGLLVGGVAVSTWQAIRATAARDRADTARLQTRKALNTLTDDAVERLMARQPRLNDGDRAFLHKVLALHEEFAAAEEDTPQARTAAADARYRVGQLRLRLGDHAAAEEAYRSAIDAQRKLVADFPDQPDHRRDLARTQVRLCALLRETGRLKPAEETCTAALDGLRALVDKFPERAEYRRELAAGHNNHGNILNHLNRPADAEAAFRGAIDLLSPPSHRPEDRRMLLIAYQSLGNHLIKTKRFGPAEECSLASADIRRKLADEFPGETEYRLDLATQLDAAGHLYTETDRRPKAEEVLREAVGILQKLVDEFPTRTEFRLQQARTQANLANLLTRLKKHRPAEEAYTVARAGFERLAGDHPTVADYRSGSGLAVAGLALLKSLGNDHVSGVRLMEQALTHDQAALEIEPTNPPFREAYRTHRAILAEMFGHLGDHVKAADAADEVAKVAYQPAQDALTAADLQAQCVLLARQDDKLAKPDRAKLATSYADRAMAHLQAAVKHGFKDAKRLRADESFEPLHDRDDFKKLLPQ